LFDDDDKSGLLAAQTATANTFKDIENDLIGWDDLKDRMVTVFTDYAKLRVWMDKFSTFRNDNPDVQPNEYPQFDRLRDELRLFWNHRLNESDNLTRIAASNYKASLWDDFDDYNPRIFLKPILAHNGRMYHIWGIPGSGKTDFALKLIEFVLAENLEGKKKFSVITNIYSPQATLVRFAKEVPSTHAKLDNFYRTVRMTDLIWKTIQEIRKGRNIIVAWDEVSSWAHKQDAATKGNKDLGRLCRLIRKFNGNIFFLEQIDEGLMGQVSEMLVAKFQKKSEKKLHFTTRYGDKNYNLFLKSVPRTNIKFESADFAGFIPDLDLKRMFDFIAIDDEGDKLDEIEKYIQSLFMEMIKPSVKRPKKKRRYVKKKKT
jgi:hypothetical protein